MPKRNLMETTILNYIKVNEHIATSGQPTKEEFEYIANAGYEIVINLSMNNSEGRIEQEDEVVTNLKMNYIHIPVDFTAPSEENLLDFIEMLSMLEHRKVWVHCIMNYRVTAFMYVYHKYVLQTPFDDIDLSILEEWSPDEAWQNIMKTQLQ